MHQERGIQVLPVEGLSHSGQKDHREFQPFRFVYRHNPYSASFFTASPGNPEVAPVLSQPVNKDEKAE
ncbi:hypothetical protein D3C80_1738240 [compost metagenome]